MTNTDELLAAAARGSLEDVQRLLEQDQDVIEILNKS